MRKRNSPVVKANTFTPRAIKQKFPGPVRDIGVISDTHGLLRPEVPPALSGVDLIIHTGDIGKPEVIAGLQKIAPVYCVRGNNDRAAWARHLPDILCLTVSGIQLYVIHVLQDLRCDPAAAGFRAVISGHSHRPALTSRNGVLYINPGSAGPRRFTLPVALARLRVTCGGNLVPKLIDVFTGKEQSFDFNSRPR